MPRQPAFARARMCFRANSTVAGTGTHGSLQAWFVADTAR